MRKILPIILICCFLSLGSGSRDMVNTASSGADYITWGDAFYSDDFTYCLWFYPETVDTGARTIVAKRNDDADPPAASANIELHLYFTATGIFFNSWKSGNVVLAAASAASTVTANIWNFSCMVSEGNGGTNYVYFENVKNSGNTNDAALQNTTSSLQIGARTNNNNTRWLDGQTAYFLASSNALSYYELNQLSYFPTLLYNGAQIISPILGNSPENDLSGNGKTGALHSSPPTSNNGPPIMFGGGLYL